MTQDEIRAIAHQLHAKLPMATQEDAADFAVALVAAIAEKAEPVGCVYNDGSAVIHDKHRGRLFAHPAIEPAPTDRGDRLFNKMTFTNPTAPLPDVCGECHGDPDLCDIHDCGYAHKQIEPKPLDYWHQKDCNHIEQQTKGAAPLPDAFCPHCNPCRNGERLAKVERALAIAQIRGDELQTEVNVLRAVEAAPLPDEVREMVERLRGHEWVPIVKQAADLIERLARERDQAVIRRDEIAHSLQREEVERLARQVPPDCAVVQRKVTEEAKCVLATPGNYRTYQDQWTALIAAGEVKP